MEMNTPDRPDDESAPRLKTPGLHIGRWTILVLGCVLLAFCVAVPLFRKHTIETNEIKAKAIPDEGGLKDVMVYFNAAVQMTSIVALGLQVYEFLRKKKRETGNSQTITIEAPGVSDQPLSLAIDPGKAKPVIKIQLENMQKQFERSQ